ncbi:MAG: hypothetical protein ACOCVM_02710, partial [Desulfovibrionaceae bacterium]
MQQKNTRGIKGIFSRRTSSGRKAQEFYFAKEASSGTVGLRKLDKKFVPHGEQMKMDRETFLKKYMLEPDLWYRHVTGRLVRADAYRQNDRPEEATLEYSRALEVDEENIRGMYGLGL